MSKTFAAAWVSVLALVVSACGDDPAKVENLFLKVTSDAPTGGGDLDALRVLFVKGDVRFPADATQSEFNPVLGDLDPVAGPVYLSIRYDGETFGSDPTGVTLQVTGRIAGKPVVAFEGVVDLADNVILPVHMDALDAACDEDGDGFFDCAVSGCCVADSVLGDCAPSSADGSPWGSEDPCEDTDAIDNDCQGGDVVPANSDGDPVNDCKETACGADASRDDVYPGATELCDTRDNDCDGSTDEGLTLATPGGNLALGAECGLGKCAGGEVQCDGAGAVECSTADLANPAEGCEGADDGVDDDCDGLTDEGCDVTVDVDGDGVSADADCDDYDPGRYPGNIVPEACCDPAAQNDAAARAACDRNCNDADITYCEANDADGDGFTVAEGDCDDDPSDDTLFPARLVYPGAEEKCGDSVDQDCLLGDLACTGLTDVDQDGWPASVDCNDGDNTIKPDAPEVCNGKDDDCDTLIDDGNPGGGVSCGSDVGECVTGTTVCVRALPEGEGCLAGQAPCFVCPNDVEPVAETCNGKDDNCADGTDETFEYEEAGIGEPCDGVGACGQGTVECVAGDVTQVTCSTNPNGSASQAQTEVCDALDNDCDGTRNEDLTDVDDSDCDRDGVCGANLQMVHATCLEAGGWSCDYSDVPGWEANRETLCDDKDNDCDGGTDEDITFVDAVGQTRSAGDKCDGADADSCVNGDAVCDPTDQTRAVCDESNTSTAVEVCDGDDNDCDGKIDEDFKAGADADPTKALAGARYAPDNGKYLTKPNGDPQTCGTGTCGVGTVVCNPLDRTKLTCQTPSQPSEDFCDSLDNDCNGTADDRYVTGGDRPYNGGPFIDDPDTATPNDGDQGKFKGATCGTGACSGGVVICATLTELKCDKVPAVLATDVCDDIDNDCDGTTDDVYLANAPAAQKVVLAGALFATDNGKSKFATCGTGECAGGEVVCNAAHDGLVCDTNGESQTETCEGLDDSCNGSTDEGFPNLDGDTQANCVDGDDDNDGLADGPDACELGVTGWTSNTTTDHDGDGCQDANAEDGDDDNDGVLDAADRCAKGNLGWTSSLSTDYDLDGCQDTPTANDEDTDEDNDNILDVNDTCRRGDKGWLSTKGTAQAPGTDWDQDGCQDSSTEDGDDDNDSALDAADRCDPDASGASDLGANGSTIGWTRTVGTAGAPGSDWDDDGCQDSGEDADDDNDGAADTADRCDPDATGPTADTGVTGSTKGWARTIGTAGTPGSDWDDDGCQDSGEDTDDDNDGALDGDDRCDPDATGANDLGANGSTKGWTRSIGTVGQTDSDYDDDGCRDGDTEDNDDDNDTILDAADACDPDAANGALASVKFTSSVGTPPAVGSDYDADGCKDEDASNEDDDDDNDGIKDTPDRCDPDSADGALASELRWVSDPGTSTVGTDYDADGCKDTDGDDAGTTEEDNDDDNDGKVDADDRCDPDSADTTGAQRSELGWTSDPGTSTVGTDYDGDGCKDTDGIDAGTAEEDTDDDNDGKDDGSDQCDPDAADATAAQRSELGWTSDPGTSTVGTDYDGDGCKDTDGDDAGTAEEDNDDDNDGRTDDVDRCDPDTADTTGALRSELAWTSSAGNVGDGSVGTDYDADGCKDTDGADAGTAEEDTDDDNDLLDDGADRCDPDSATSPDLGANRSTIGWSRTKGTAPSPGTDWDDDGCQDSGEDGDDDNDTIGDATDACDPENTSDPQRIGSQLGPFTDYDTDGCRDDSTEDTNDDNDALDDAADFCDPDDAVDDPPIQSVKGAFTDYDGDGCSDAAAEDTDDDGDDTADAADLCDPDSGNATSERYDFADHDDDGCRDDSSEDANDDNDLAADAADTCDPDSGLATSAVGTTITGDRDSDGCRDSDEDPDDDRDSVNDVDDDCTSATSQLGPFTDYDGDGCRDDNAEDGDDDNDGRDDGLDGCDASPVGWTSATGPDVDGDGCKDDVEDDDNDGDGRLDGVDACPDGPEINWGANATNDRDGDGCRDATEDEDDDNDGVDDTPDACEGPTSQLGPFTDHDLDGCRDDHSEDDDDDNDGVIDTGDLCDPDSGLATSAIGAFADRDDDGCRDTDEDADDDGDGIDEDGSDDCASGSSQVGPFSDYDTDGCRDDHAEDGDDDNDGRGDATDLCDPDANGVADPVTSSTKEWDSNSAALDNDADGCKDEATGAEDLDDDNDTIPDDGGAAACDSGQSVGCDDNCRITSNTNQLDTDDDGQGDACDTDDDGDGDLDGADNCPLVSNADQANADGDAFGDACDTCTDIDADGWGRAGQNSTCTTPNVTDCDDTAGNTADIDRDNVCEPGDTCVDVDGDGWGRTGFTDSGCANGPADDCNDTAGNTADIDRDNVCEPGDTCVDVDGDGWGRAGFTDSTCANGTTDDCNDTAGNTEDTDHDNICATGAAGFCATGQSTGCNDNCASIANLNQLDTDRDGKGDVCDLACLYGKAPHEVCGDCIDNDCDGATDEAGCVERRIVTIQTAAESLPDDYSVSLTFDHKQLVDGNLSSLSGDDLHVYYKSPTAACSDTDATACYTQIDRVTDPSRQGVALPTDPTPGSFNQRTTKLWFRTEAAIPASTLNYDYEVYYNVVGTAVKANEANVFHFADTFTRGDAANVGGAWVETEDPANATIASRTETRIFSNELEFTQVSNTNAGRNRPYLQTPFTSISGAGTTKAWQVRFGFDWTTDGSDAEYRVQMQVGLGSALTVPVNNSDTTLATAGVGPDVMWGAGSGGISTDEAVGTVSNGAFSRIGSGAGAVVTTGPIDVQMLVDFTGTANVDVTFGALSATNRAFAATSSVPTSLDTIRIIDHKMASASFSRRRFDYVIVRRAMASSANEPYAYFGTKEPLGAGAACELDDTKLLGQYFLDDPTDVTPDPLTAMDSSADPLDLDRLGDTGNTDPNFVTVANLGALRFFALLQDGRLSKSIDGTKYVTGADKLDGIDVATFEFVIESHSATGRAYLIDFDDDEFSVRLNETTNNVIEARLGNGTAATWTLPILEAQRAVLHVVCDFSSSGAAAGASDDKLRLYYNGVLMAPTSVNLVTSSTFSFGATTTMRIGNDDNGGASWFGYLYYVGIYSRALDESAGVYDATTLKRHANILLKDDDIR